MRNRVAPGGGGGFRRPKRARCDAERPDRAAARRQALIHRHRRDAIAVGERLAGVEPVLRRPGDDDVVVGLVAGRQLEQFHPALAPAFMRLDPVARPQLVGEIEILVVAEIPVALQEPEAARVGVEEGRNARRGRIAERPPDPLAGAGMHQEAVGIVQFAAEVVVEAPIGLADEIHRGQRRKPERRRRLAREQRHIRLDHAFLARSEIEAESAGRRIRCRAAHR